MDRRPFSTRCLKLAENLLFVPWTSLPLLVTASLAVGAAAAFRQIRFFQPNQDVAWLLIAAQRLADGGAYVKDVYEVNAPLAILIYFPAALLAKLTNLEIWTAFLIETYALIGASLLTIYILLGQLLPIGSKQRGALMLVIAFVFFVLPGYEFGQREHYAVVMLLPYVVAAAVDDAIGRPKPNSLAIGVYLGAAVGALIKPFFILFPVMIFISRILQERSLATLLRADLATFVVVGLGYLILLLVVFPGWIEIMVATVILYQTMYSHPHATLIVAMISTCTVAGLILSDWNSHRSRAEVLLTRYAALSAFAAVAVFAIQGKGWTYQQLPVISFLIVAGALYFFGSVPVQSRTRMISRPKQWGIAAGYLSLIALLLVRNEFRPSALGNYKKQPFYLASAQSAPGQAILVLASNLGIAFPWVFMQQRTWSSRFPSMWLLESIVMGLAHSVDGDERRKLLDLRRSVVSMMLADIHRYRPALIFVDTRTKATVSSDRLDYLQFFETEAALEPVRKHYRRVGQVDYFVIFQRADL